MKQFIFTLLAFVWVNSIVAQESHYIPCGYDIYVNNLCEEHPHLKKAIQAPFTRNKEQVRLRGDELYTINCVIHIVYQNESQNLSDAIIYEVMNKVTKDYMRLNEDADSVRPVFKERAASANIQFKVHAIERIETDTSFEFGLFTGLPDHIKKTESGGSTAYDPDKFLNIWVGNLEGGLLGYAYPPADLFNWPDGSNAPEQGLDGVVISTPTFSIYDTIEIESAFGGESTIIPIRGRTITHEIGHYLGLRHIWGDGLAMLGIPACDEDDGIEDTPNQGLPSNFVCDTTLNTCIDPINNEKDMVENFMDYASEPCQNSFTQGQVAHIRSVLENERTGLIDSTTQLITTEEPDFLEIYPNPAQNYLNVRLKNTMKEKYLLTIYDMQGNLVFSERISPGKQFHQVITENFHPGLYLLRISSQDSQDFKKFIIY